MNKNNKNIDINNDIEKSTNNTAKKVNIMPALPLRGLTVFPGMTFHFDVSRRKSVKALEAAMAGDGEVFLVSQLDLRAEDPGAEDIFKVGTVAKIRQLLKLPKDMVRILIEGKSRGTVAKMLQTEPYMVAAVDIIEESKPSTTKRAMAMVRKMQEVFSDYASASGTISDDVMLNVLQDDNLGHLCDYICQNAPLSYDQKQDILETLNVDTRGKLLLEILSGETEIIELENQIQMRVKMGIDKHQREYYLREQIKVINEELGEGEDSVSESLSYQHKIYDLELDEESEKKLMKEAVRLGKMHSSSPESAVIRNYLDVCLDLPWHKESRENPSIQKAQTVLNRDHYGMEKVKERILEMFAVRAMSGQGSRGQIVCLVGPPGVGKTSIASSIARAMGRKFARLSLGGVRDEAEIRGHRKTYIGAMPGRFITAVRQAGSENCVILVDEIDKIGGDYKGDPNAALLEIFDVEQNSAFRDHFVEIPFDFSKVLFIATANDIDNIPRPLLDRMEVIELGSYTDIEKLHIARGYLLPKQMKKHGLKAGNLKLTDMVINRIIEGYTKESGVRNLERTLAKLCRKISRSLYESGQKKATVGVEELTQYLGVARYLESRDTGVGDECGVVNGLAYTAVGGELLTIEVNLVKGTGKQEVTGNLGDVMKESVRAAITYIRSRVDILGIDPEFYTKQDIHVHFPEAAVPKDGPSAGIGIASAIISALTGVPVDKTYAMTGEITIRGRVLPIGGLREKTMAAYRNGVRTVIVPLENKGDIEELGEEIKAGLRFKFVSNMDQVTKLLFPTSIPVQGVAILPDTSSPEIAIRQ